jgi:hypothetical protein
MWNLLQQQNLLHFVRNLQKKEKLLNGINKQTIRCNGRVAKTEE